jgi:D-ribose pyranase
MFKTGILNPAINHLLSRARHTNTFVIADRGFPYWPMIETVDISLIDDIPSVLDVLLALRPNFLIGHASMAEEFLKNNTPETIDRFKRALDGIPHDFEPHVGIKRRVPNALGLIRTGDTIQYANMILESA